MKTNEIHEGKWYIIRESQAEARRRWPKHGDVLWGECLGDSGKGHKKFKILTNPKDKINYNTEIERHTCRSVIAELGFIPIPIEGTTEHEEWMQRIYDLANKEFIRDNRRERCTALADLLNARFSPGEDDPDVAQATYRGIQLIFDSDALDWIADLIEPAIFSLDTLDLNAL